MTRSMKRAVTLVLAVVIMLAITVTALAASGTNKKVGDGFTQLGSQAFSSAANMGFSLTISTNSPTNSYLGQPTLYPYAELANGNIVPPFVGSGLKTGTVIWSSPSYTTRSYPLSVQNQDWETYISYSSTVV